MVPYRRSTSDLHLKSSLTCPILPSYGVLSHANRSVSPSSQPRIPCSIPHSLYRVGQTCALRARDWQPCVQYSPLPILLKEKTTPKVSIGRRSTTLPVFCIWGIRMKTLLRHGRTMDTLQQLSRTHGMKHCVRVSWG